MDGAGVEEAHARAVWSVLAEPGDGVAGALIADLGAAEALGVATLAEDVDLRAVRGRWLPHLRVEAVDAVLDAARRWGASLIVPGAPSWPGRVNDLGVHAPAALWRRGRDVGVTRSTVALVGARASTAYGEGAAADLSADLSSAGVVVVSGAAYGMDGAAHRAALSRGGTTVAFLAGAWVAPILGGTRACSRGSRAPARCGSRRHAVRRPRNEGSSRKSAVVCVRPSLMGADQGFRHAATRRKGS